MTFGLATGTAHTFSGKHKMKKVSQEEWDAARLTFYKVLNDWEHQSNHIQAQMKSMSETIQFNLKMQKDSIE